jgi:hypothetical protein
MRLNFKRILLLVAVSITTLIEANAMSGSKIRNFRFENYKTADKAFEEYREKKFGADFTKQLSDEDYHRIIDIRLKKQYKKDAMTDLLKLHPVGTDVKPLLATLKNAGADIKEKDLTNARKFKEYDKWWEEGTVTAYTFYYDKASPFFMVINYLEWGGTVRVDSNNKIINLVIYRKRAY